MKTSNVPCLLSSWVVHGLLFLLLVVFILGSKIYPYADDWAYLSPLNMHSGVEYIKWLFVQHVDHRIPIQKALHSFLGIHTGFDFRVLIFLNGMLALLISVSLVESARLYRGYRHVGDLFVPLILLSPVMGYSLWAFQFQFLSSILFVSASFYFFCKYNEGKQTYFHSLALIQLFLCSWCGMNGVIFSSVLICAVIVISALQIKNNARFSIWSLLLIAIVFFVNVALWVSWTPSAASSGTTNIYALLECFFKLLPASMIVYTFSDAVWNILIVLSGLLLAFYGVARELKKRNLSALSVLAMAVVSASLAIIASAAIARSKGQGAWDNTLIMHYGSLTILLPIFSWFVISKYFSDRVTYVVALIALIVFSCAYYKNFEWRYEFSKSSQERQRVVGNAFKENLDAADLVDSFSRDLTWSDSDEAKMAVVVGLEELRKFGYPIYTPVNADGTTFLIKGLARKELDAFYNGRDAISINSSDICKGSIDVLGKVSPAPESLSVSGVLDISGWLSSLNDSADETYLVLTDDQGSRIYFRTNVYERPDVSEYFRNDKLRMSGFSASVNLHKMHGSYRLSLAMKINGALTACDNLGAVIKVGGENSEQ